MSETDQAEMTDAEVAKATFEKRHVQILQKFEKIFEAEKTYTTLVTTAGYAALLAVWNGAGQQISHNAKLASGALLGISILIFVVFEIIKLQTLVRSGFRYNVLIESKIHSQSFEDDFRSAQIEAYKDTARINKFQPVQFWPSLVFGVLAAILLIGNMLSVAFLHLSWPS